MAPRIDSENRILELAVADLLEAQLARSLGFAQRGGYERLWLGQAIHSHYQEEALAADGTYQREVVVRLEMEHRGWRVVLHGRIDGLRREPEGGLVVEEIKSVRRGAELSATVREMYERQALLYAWMLERQGEEAVSAELVLIEIGGGGLDREPLSADRSQLEADIHRRLSAIIRAEERQGALRELKHRAAETLTFPYPELRSGQEEIAAAVDTALEQREHLLLEATTGIGKTVATLYPALRYALAHDKRVFVLTAKTLQQEMAETVVGLLARDGAFHGVRLRAKKKMCANNEVICHEEYCPYARDYFSKLHTSGVIRHLRDDAALLTPDAIYAGAKAAEVCPFEVSLELAQGAEVVICDYNYVFDPYVALGEFSGDHDLSDVILVIDEAHNLVDRGRGYYSPELTSQAARMAAAAAEGGRDEIHGVIATLMRRAERWVEAQVESALEDFAGRGESVEATLPEDDLWALRPELDEAFVDYLEYQRESKSFRAEDPFVTFYFDFLRFLNGLVASQGGAFSQIAERRGGESVVRILCKDPSPFLGRTLARVHSVVALSATLSPTAFYRDLLGFDPARTAALSVPNPFPAENRGVVIDARVATSWRKRPENYPLIAERLGSFAESVPGNCLALFPSYDFLRSVAELLDPRSKRVLVQDRADSDRERQAILDALRGAVLRDVLLLAVAGGVFAEGVDYPGDTLKAVAVIGPCLPGVSLDRELLKQYYQERFERGFEYAFVVPGMTRVVQAAGRLIRSAQDTGVIALFGERFLINPYRRNLPSDWLPEDRATDLARDPATSAARFFAALVSP